jgi:hypothetical protein
LLAEREQEERGEKERVSKEHEEEKVSGHTITFHFTIHILGQSCG